MWTAPSANSSCDSRYLAIPFFDACLAMRLPDQGSKDQTLKPVDKNKAWLAPVFGDTAQPEFAPARSFASHGNDDSSHARGCISLGRECRDSVPGLF